MGTRIPINFEGDHDSHWRGKVDVGGSDMLGELYAPAEVLLILTERQPLPCAHCRLPAIMCVVMLTPGAG